MGVLLTDRGSEFSDPLAIERSCLEPGKRRCRVFYCDPLAPGQKGACERNHVEIRKLLPKGAGIRFDRLAPADLALAIVSANLKLTTFANASRRMR